MNPLVDFLAPFEPSIAIAIFAALVLIIINLCYKFLVKQDEAKRIKAKVKEINEEMKKYQKENNKEKVKELMNQSMLESSKLTKMSMKPMVVSLIIVILILPGLNSLYVKAAALNNNIGNVTIDNDIFTVQMNSTVMTVSSINGSFDCEINKKCVFNYKSDSGNAIWYVTYRSPGFMGPERVEFERVVLFLPYNFPWVENDLGWLGYYIFISIPLTLIIRKLLKIEL